MTTALNAAKTSKAIAADDTFAALCLGNLKTPGDSLVKARKQKKKREDGMNYPNSVIPPCRPKCDDLYWHP